MNNRLLRLLPAVLLVSGLTACEEPGSSPLADCVTASVEYKNEAENIYYQQSNFSDDNFEAYNSLPRSITVPSGTMLKVNAIWNLREYEVDNAEIDKVFVKTVQGQLERSCQIIADAQNTLPYVYIPAYENMTIHVRFVLKSGAEHTVGPFNITVQSDNKTLIGSGVELLASSVASDQEGRRYLWSPYYLQGFVGRGTTHVAPLESSFNQSNNRNTSTAFGLLAFTNQGVAANQIKVVASDRIQALGLYPELTENYSCYLGANFARFESVNLPIDTAAVATSFENFYTNANLTYASLDTLTLTNPVSELVVSKLNPCFKFITSAGKKGYAAVVFTDNKNASLYYFMQR